MRRREQIERIESLEYQLLAARTYCWLAGQRPLRLIQRNSGWLAPVAGIAAGLVASKATGRPRLSALFSAIVTARRLQPMLMKVIQRI